LSSAPTGAEVPSPEARLGVQRTFCSKAPNGAQDVLSTTVFWGDGGPTCAPTELPHFHVLFPEPRHGAKDLHAFGVATLLNPSLFAAESAASGPAVGRDFPAKAKRVIYLFQSGGPAQLDLFDYKPNLLERYKEEVPTSVYPAERKTSMTAGQTSFPVAPTRLKFAQHGPAGAWISDALPHTASIAHELCIVKSMYTEAINHDPAITFWLTGSQIAGRPSMGAWLSYGLGSDAEELPHFVAMSSGTGGQPIYDRLWGSGFLPTRYQGVKFRGQGDPVLDLTDPPGVTGGLRRDMLDVLGGLNRHHGKRVLDPAIEDRIAQYEMAYRLQTSIPELTDLSKEPKHVLDLYGPDVRKQGSYAWNCLMARRLAERGVRFTQLLHRGWDTHNKSLTRVRALGKVTDQAQAGLVTDLRQRGLLDDTLVIWGGEFGRTVYCQGKLTETVYGRDHHPGCFTMWLAGGGIKGGMVYGETDDYSVRPIDKPVHVHDMQATKSSPTNTKAATSA